MRPTDILSYSLSAILRRKLRATLTILGVAIGVAAIVALLTLSQGLQGAVAYQLQAGLATDTLMVTSKDSSLFVKDSLRIESIDHVLVAAPLVQMPGYIEKNGSTSEIMIVGVDFDKYRAVYGQAFTVQLGEMPSDPSGELIVVGVEIYDPEQNSSPPVRIGDPLEISWTKNTVSMPDVKTYTGHVAGVLNEIGTMSTGGLSDIAVYVPISKASELFGTDACNLIIVKLDGSDQATIDAATSAIESAFNGHVQISSSKRIHDLVSGVFDTINIFLLAIASISLMVAGVGIMNIMMVSLVERTKEIGILKALGTSDRTILLIFLCEAGIIGLIGGLVGALLGYSSVVVIVRLIGDLTLPSDIGRWAAEPITITPVLDPLIFVGAMIFGLINSLVFGLYPSWKSSRMAPVAALRSE
ncbi:MAG: ABC transporter permease [Euryarchaeota archaeon]|nr:ABC transporter permease [Euryarchaeota archaeon]